MATVSVTSSLSNELGRAIVETRQHHFIIDSPPPLGGPNEELNPLDILLAALATCGTFVIETAAREMKIPLKSVHVDAEGDFDPRGVKGEPGVDPRITEFRVKVNLDGTNPDQTNLLIEQFKARCPVYTTLSRAAPVKFEIA
jgi:putative redox protein